MTRIGHVMILASAGSGKTYALTNRFVRLLALGASPDRIVALTFTRKAAGEFFDEILKKLARAASDPIYARQLAGEIGWKASVDTPIAASRKRNKDASAREMQIELPLWSSANSQSVASVETRTETSATPDFLKMLRAVADAMPRLRLGTFDGFFARIARNFPLELGLTGEFSILQEHAARVERSRVLRRMFERTGELADAQREFIEAFKRATFGAEEKRLGAQLDGFLDEHQEIFLSARDRDSWGNPQRIWPDGRSWLGTSVDSTAALKTLRAWIGSAAVGEKQRTRWNDFLDAWQKWTPGIVPPRPLAYVIEKALDAWSHVEAGRAVLLFDRKKQELSPPASEALAELTRSVIGREIDRRMEVTRGIYAVLQSYESFYHDAVRRAGKLTFSDVQRLLMPEEGAPMLSSGADVRVQKNAEIEATENERAVTMTNRLAIDFRLDAEIDHWLLDEFQDTSFGQWSVLRNLIDEAVQDPTGARSFFFVGDVKQAIFAWREGDPRLFREIFNHYNAAQPGTIAEEHLVTSWRSGPPVIATVNRVFGDAAVLAELFPGEASKTWNREWRAHESAKPELGGQAALLTANTEAERFAVALGILEEINPIERGLTCALLVQNNATAAKLADYLRQQGGLPAMAESDLHICTDNPLGTALLALVKAAAHPGDSLAWEHWRMTPLVEVLVAEGICSREQLTRHVTGRIYADGFEKVMRHWTRALQAKLAPDDEFSRERARQFTAAAGLFDATGSRDVAEFVEFMQRHVVRDADLAGVIRVMTIHKAKGLGFDLVILPDLEGTKLDCRREGLAVHKADDRTVRWVLDLPGRLFHEHDRVLSAHVRAAESDACYENLSLLYVAMTRAKQAMYLIAKPPGASTSRNYPKLLAETLGEETVSIRIGRREFVGSFTEGNADWHVGIAVKAAAAHVSVEIGQLDNVQRSPRLLARRASVGKAAEVTGAQMFLLARRGAAEFGTAVHGLLAEVEWGSEEEMRRLESVWKARDLPAEIVEEALACLREPTLASIWLQPQLLDLRRTSADFRETGDVWREKTFEVALDGAWITGIFDRVIVSRNAAGFPVAAAVIDFKTDRIGPEESLNLAVARHATQLNLYRRVAAILTGLPIGSVTCQLVFTRLRRMVRVPPSS